MGIYGNMGLTDWSNMNFSGMLQGIDFSDYKPKTADEWADTFKAEDLEKETKAQEMKDLGYDFSKFSWEGLGLPEGFGERPEETVARKIKDIDWRNVSNDEYDKLAAYGDVSSGGSGIAEMLVRSEKNFNKRLDKTVNDWNNYVKKYDKTFQDVKNYKDSSSGSKNILHFEGGGSQEEKDRIKGIQDKLKTDKEFLKGYEREKRSFDVRYENQGLENEKDIQRKIYDDWNKQLEGMKKEETSTSKVKSNSNLISAGGTPSGVTGSDKIKSNKSKGLLTEGKDILYKNKIGG